jgi:hypothetical protein
MEAYADTVVSRTIIGTGLASRVPSGKRTGLGSYFSKVKGRKQMTKQSQLSKPVQTFSGLGSYFSKVKSKQSKYIRF